MAYEEKILADSIASGVRLTTHLITHPRFILAEVNTHRVFSRNSASSRAIPVEKRIEQILADPFVPEAFGANKKGMQAGETLGDDDQIRAQAFWLRAMDAAIVNARQLALAGVHKQWANRVLEPYCWHTAIVTSTEWDNFFALRCNPEASPEFRKIAEMMRDAMALSKPKELAPGEWHLPLVFDEDYEQTIMQRPEYPTWVQERLSKLSVARCARVSYLTHEGKRDINADLVLYDRLLTSGHMSPFEHAARVALPGEFTNVVIEGTRRPNGGGLEIIENGHKAEFPMPFIGNFRRPWVQHRKLLPNEDVFQGKR